MVGRWCGGWVGCEVVRLCFSVQVVWWAGGVVDRWCGGQVVCWAGGVCGVLVCRWCGGQVV